MVHIKRTHLMAIAIIVSIVGLWWAIETTQASVDYWIEKQETYRKGLNSVKIRCKNGGRTDGDFYLVLTFINVTFSNQTEKPYMQVDNSTVKCRFGLHEGESNLKQMHFFINETVTSFSIQLSLEKISLFLKENRVYPTLLWYKWNQETEMFCCID